MEEKKCRTGKKSKIQKCGKQNVESQNVEMQKYRKENAEKRNIENVDYE